MLNGSETVEDHGDACIKNCSGKQCGNLCGRDTSLAVCCVSGKYCTAYSGVHKVGYCSAITVSHCDIFSYYRSCLYYFYCFPH